MPLASLPASTTILTRRASDVAAPAAAHRQDHVEGSPDVGVAAPATDQPTDGSSDALKAPPSQLVRQSASFNGGMTTQMMQLKLGKLEQFQDPSPIKPLEVHTKVVDLAATADDLGMGGWGAPPVRTEAASRPALRQLPAQAPAQHRSGLSEFLGAITSAVGRFFAAIAQGLARPTGSNNGPQPAARQVSAAASARPEASAVSNVAELRALAKPPTEKVSELLDAIRGVKKAKPDDASLETLKADPWKNWEALVADDDRLVAVCKVAGVQIADDQIALMTKCYDFVKSGNPEALLRLDANEFNVNSTLKAKFMSFQSLARNGGDLEPVAARACVTEIANRTWVDMLSPGCVTLTDNLIGKSS